MLSKQNNFQAAFGGRMGPAQSLVMACWQG